MKDLNKHTGCLLGGAAGDALGYAVEFLREEQIFSKYGINGITEYELINGEAQISDDTQMTLFTANALLLAYDESAIISAAKACYKEWYITQSCLEKDPDLHCVSWLTDVSALYSRRAPGITCLTAIEAGFGSIRNPINNSKGCGGIMRIAPVGLYFEDAAKAAVYAAGISALTHGHELGYIPSAVFAYIISAVSQSDISLQDAVKSSVNLVCEMFPDAVHLNELVSLIEKAVSLAANKSVEELDAIHQLGEGWVAEETLAIALFCALRHENNFEKALIAAVNHNGDSDSTGSVCGNILGAYLGIDCIPAKFRKNLGLSDIILTVATDLYEEKITENYISE